MKIAISCVITEETAGPAVVARAAESLGFEGLFIPEHPVIPVVHRTRYPDPARDGEIPEFYSHMPDPFVLLAMASWGRRMAGSMGSWRLCAGFQSPHRRFLSADCAARLARREHGGAQCRCDSVWRPKNAVPVLNRRATCSDWPSRRRGQHSRSQKLTDSERAEFQSIVGNAARIFS